MGIATGRLASTTVEIGGKDISFETGKLAKQAEGADFFPLTVDVEERMYAAGKIPGGFFKREGRPTERAILTARMIDRPIRPLWPAGYKNEVHVVCTSLQAVEEDSTLDLIVVGTREALTMIEAGAEELPEDAMLEAFEIAHAEIVKICDAQDDLRRQAGKPKYLDPELTAELEGQYSDRVRQRIET